MRALDDKIALYTSDKGYIKDIVDLFFENVIKLRDFDEGRILVYEDRFLKDLEKINSFWRWNLRAPREVSKFVNSYLDDENVTIFQEMEISEIQTMWNKHLALIGEDDGWIVKNVDKISLTMENLEVLKDFYPELRGRYTSRKFNL